MGTGWWSLISKTNQTRSRNWEWFILILFFCLNLWIVGLIRYSTHLTTKKTSITVKILWIYEHLCWRDKWCLQEGKFVGLAFAVWQLFIDVADHNYILAHIIFIFSCDKMRKYRNEMSWRAEATQLAKIYI